MKSWKPRTAFHQAMVKRVALAADDDKPAPPDEVVDWLARLFLLYGVPFEYLVPDYRMLPQESIRWSFWDINWLQRAMDGALSIGRTGSQDVLADRNVTTALTKLVQQRMQLVRAKLRNKPAPSEISEGGNIAVLLIRSAVIGGYPGLEVKGYDAGGADVKLLRMDQLAKDVLLVMFEDLPAQVQLIEPPEGLHFGVRIGSVTSCSTGSTDDDQPFTLLRSLQAGQIGTQITQDGEAVSSQVFYRDADLRVLDVESTLSELECWLQKTDGWAADSLSAADFAVEMIRAAGLQEFVPNPPEASPSVEQESEQ